MQEVLAGLKGGEDVVTSAQFMLDSESRFREAVKMMMPGTDTGGKKEGEKPAVPGTQKEGKPPAAPAPAPMPPGMKMEGQKEAPPAALPPGPKH